MRTSTVITTLALALSASAKTDLAGCVSSAIGASLLWYVPDTCEQCKILDCGGGRAPPKTTVPGCAAYKGTDSYQPTYLTFCGQAPATSVPAPTTTAGEAYETSSAPAGYPASSTPVASKSSEPAGYPVSSGTPSHESTLATITSKPLSTGYYTATGIASLTYPHSVKNNGTASSTVRVPSNGTISTGGPKLPESTGGAALLSVGQGLMALAAGALGVAML